MLAYDVIKKCDITQAISIYLDNFADDNELANREETIAKLYSFWRMACGLTPEPYPENILIALEKYDIYEGTNIGADLYKKDNFEEHLQIIQRKEFPLYSEDDSAEELKNIYHSINGWFPERYDYEWSPWEEILGFTVFKENIERYEKDAVVAYLFYEMTFDGWTKEMRDERIGGFAEAICSMVKDIGNGHTINAVENTKDDMEEITDDAIEAGADEVCEENSGAGTTDKEEINAERKSIWLEVLRNYETIFEELKMIYTEWILKGRSR